MYTLTLSALLLASCSLVAVSAQPALHVAGTVPTNPLEPLQHRSAYAGADGKQHVVQWSTYAPLNASQVVISYGTSPDPSTFRQSSVGSVRTFDSSVNYVNTVLLQGLQPATKYYWYPPFTNCTQCQQTPLATFTTAFPAGDRTPYSIAVFGDLGIMGIPSNVTTVAGTFPVEGMNPSLNPFPAYDPTHNTMISLNNSVTYGNITFVAHVGDIGYADYVYNIMPKSQFVNSPLNNTANKLAGAKLYDTLYNAFYDQVQPITAQVPYMVTAGNHEGTCSDGHDIDMCLVGDTNFTAYNTHWEMPSASSNGTLNMWYSFDQGLAHYVMIESETDFENAPSGPGGSELQYGTVVDPYGQGPFAPPAAVSPFVQWFNNDLASVNRSVTPWIVVMAHRPWYISSSGKAYAQQVQFEPAMIKYDVDFVFSGHNHIVERLCAIEYGGTCHPNGYNNPKNAPVYIIEGAAGKWNGLSLVQDEPENYGGLGGSGLGGKSYPATQVFEPYSRFFDNQHYGYGVLTFHNTTHATYGHVQSNTSAVTDSFTLYKDHIYSTN